MKHIKTLLVAIVTIMFATNIQAQEIVKIDANDFKEKIWNYEQDNEYKYKGTLPCVVDFAATWCGPCRRMEPILEELAKKYEGKIIIYQVDVDQNRQLSKKFNVSSIPYFVFFTKAGMTDAVGSRSQEEFEQLLIQQLGIK